jgi:hypothetical protein
MTRWRDLVSSGIVATLLCLTFSQCRAQSLWLPRDRPHGLLLEAAHPSIEHADPDFLTGAAYLGARVELGSVALVAEIPYARFSGMFFEYYYGYLYYPAEDNTIGNPYFGFEVQAPGSPFFVELGVRAPLADDQGGLATITGRYTDPSRSDAFAPNAVPIHLVVNVRELTPGRLLARLRLGTMLIIPEEGGRDSRLFAVFAWQIGYEGSCVRLGSAISGTSELSYGDNVGSETTTELEVHGDFGTWVVRPGIDLRLPFGDVANTVPLVLGVSVGAVF